MQWKLPGARGACARRVRVRSLQEPVGNFELRVYKKMTACVAAVFLMVIALGLKLVPCTRAVLWLHGVPWGNGQRDNDECDALEEIAAERAHFLAAVAEKRHRLLRMRHHVRRRARRNLVKYN